MSLRPILILGFALVLLIAMGVRLALDGDQPDPDQGARLPEITESAAELDSPEPEGPARAAQESNLKPTVIPRLPDLPVNFVPGLYTLHGEVLDATSLEPVKMFRMACMPVGEDIEQVLKDPVGLRTFSNPIGTFTWHRLEPGSYNLLIRIGGYETLIVRGVSVPTSEEKLSLRLSRGAYVTVQVNDLEGEGISDLEVRLNPLALDEPEKGAPTVQLRFTDKFGRTRFTNLPTGTYSVSLNSVGLTEYESERFYLGPGANYPAVFQVPTLNTVHVLAKDAKGNTLGTVQVRMWRQEGRGIFRTETAPDGTAEIDHVPQGEYTVKLFKLGFRRKNQTLSVPTATGDVPLNIVMVEDPLALERELHPTPEQLDRLKLGERPSDVFTDPDGKDG
ncbi:MAG: carboxypeptidase-like regulatory domain-containing protein [Planctomycetota bacterium]